MKLVSYRHNGSVRIGAVLDDQVVDLNAPLPAAEALPGDMVAFLELGDSAMDAARRAVARYEAERPASAATPLASCGSEKARPPVTSTGGRTKEDRPPPYNVLRNGCHGSPPAADRLV